MAFIILTDPQKDMLLNDAAFQSETKWGILNKSAYWSGQDGTNPPDGNTSFGHNRWRKSYNFAVAINQNPSIAENIQIVKYFLIQFKNVTCVDDSVQFNTSQVVAKLLSLSQFDAASDKWFDSQIATNL